MRLNRVLAACGVALAMCSAAAMASPGQEKLRADLPDVLANAQNDELVPITIILTAQAAPFDINELRSMDKQTRRQFVMDELKAVAEGTQGRVLGVLAQAEQTGAAQDVHPLWLANVITAKVTPDVAIQIAGMEEVDYLNYDRPVGREVFPVRPAVGQGQDGGITNAIECGVSAMNAPAAWSAGYTGAGVLVADIDTGNCITHTDIRNQIWYNPGEIPGNGIDDDGNGYKDDVNGWSFDGGGSNNNISDNDGHGSHTAGTVAGDGTAGTQCGMAPDCTLQIIKFWNSLSGEGAAWNCMQYSLENGAAVTTNSYGWLHAWSPDRRTWRMLCENAFAAGLIQVFAAGNEGSSYGIDSVRTPGDVPDQITVGATNCSMNIASFSSRGPVTWSGVSGYNDWPYPPGKTKPEISAPGEGTISHSRCSGYMSLSGTSMATPHVAGCVALMLQANPNLDHYQVLQILKATSIDRGTSGEDNVYGSGFVDCWAAVQAARDSACRADFNGDGNVNSLDVLSYLNAWNAGDSSADIDGDGDTDSLDVLQFLNLWNAGC